MKINEITYSSGIQSLRSVVDVQKSFKIGDVESLSVYQQDLGNGTCYFLFDEIKNQCLSYVATDNNVNNGHTHLNQIENISDQKGTLSTLLFFLTKCKGFKFYIAKEDPMTIDGLRWIISSIKSNRNLFTFVDEQGNKPNIKNLQKDWDNSQQDDSYKGTISIFIESITGNTYDKIFENTIGLLKPMYRILMDKKLL